MFVATTSINKNCLYSFSLSLYCALSTCCSLLLRDAHAQKQAASRDSLYVQYMRSQPTAAYFLPSLRPLFAAAFDVLCVRFFVCPLLSCAARFRHYVALVDYGSAALRGGVTANITCSAFFAHAPSPPVDVPVAPLTQLLPNWRRHCRRRQGRLLPSYTAFIFSCFGFFSQLCTCIIKLTFCTGGQRS